SADSNMVINNKLKINYQHGRKIPEDEKIRKHIENSLSWDTRFDERYLEVSVEGGNVQLKGVVDSYWKVPEIEKKISGIYGVNSIQNNLTVVPSRELQDRTIAQKISGSLNRARDIDTSNIQITVDNGEVTLSGTVLKKYQKNIAEEITMFTPGVVLVNNDLLVKK
ncbi:MAG: BON domain-containing protein, partial [Vulcanimicrobiota bacterium]